MTNKELADLIYPHITKTIEDYEIIYPERNLKEGAVVSRFAPSPTGFVHMGSLLASFIEKKVPQETEGVFFLRIEDTDGKRTVENGIQGILDDLKAFDMLPDEGPINEEEEIGSYGPYIQSKRKEIYETYVKHLIEEGYAYPCFCTNEEIDEIRTYQEKRKERIGYYGKYAKCRFLTNEERAEKIKNGEKYIIRLKSPGSFDSKVVLNDLVRGKIEMPENDIDVVLIKSDGLPLYHLAHVIDDHLMRTTHVMRGEEWIPSYPIHAQLFKIFGFKLPKFAHLGLVMKIDEQDGTKRKLSKRKDPEAAVSYYDKMGIPTEAVKLYLMTIANSNFESWLSANKDKTLDDYHFDFKKMSASGSLFDIEKLLNISKNYISTMKAKDLYKELLNWAKTYDKDYYDLIVKYEDYTIKTLNIERERKKPRKDYAMYSEIKAKTYYMYDELFKDVNYDYQKITAKEEIKTILNLYIEKYLNLDSQEEWFNQIKLMCQELGYASEMKDYKENPDSYKGNITDITTVLRVSLTGSSMTPDLFEIMTLFGKERIKDRFNQI